MEVNIEPRIFIQTDSLHIRSARFIQVRPQHTFFPDGTAGSLRRGIFKGGAASEKQASQQILTIKGATTTIFHYSFFTIHFFRVPL